MNFIVESPETKISRWQGEQILADIGLTPEKVRELICAGIFASKLQSIKNRIDAVKKKAVRMKIAKAAPKRKSRKKKIEAAKKAVELFKGGKSAAFALKSVGLSCVYTKALKECASGGGPITDSAMAQTAKNRTVICSNGAAFIRWFYGKPVYYTERVTVKQTKQLLARIKKAGIAGRDISLRAGLYHSAVSNVTCGNNETFSAEAYNAICRVLDGVKGGVK